MTMLKNNKQYIAALEQWFSHIPLSELDGKTVLVTGATGMIGSCLVDMLCQWNSNGGNVHVIATSRNTNKLAARFGAQDNLSFAQWDAGTPLQLDRTVDYIVHSASNADPINYAKYPVDTLLANVLGVHTLLEYGREHEMKRLLYVSSGEMYGQPDIHFSDFTEAYCGPVDHSSARACYPAGKRSAEVLCQCFIKQYEMDAVIVRPCHIFGPTMTSGDSRAASEFLRNAAVGKNIVMKSAGLVERSHCYVVDAAAAMLLVLLKGEKGGAYNIADPAYKMTIRDFADRAAAAGGSKVIYEDPSDAEKAGYSPVSRAVLDSEKLRQLGWHPKHESESAIAETVHILREIEEG